MDSHQRLSNAIGSILSGFAEDSSPDDFCLPGFSAIDISVSPESS
jgi:hypothetical protein